MEELWSEWLSFLAKGGVVMWPLAVSAVVLWFALAYRLFKLRRGTNLGIRELIEKIPEESDAKPPATTGFIDTAAVVAVRVRRIYAGEIRRFLDDELFQLIEDMGGFRTLIRTIVLVAPLAGLLGTVSGMIEMFESLGDQTFYSQSGGVANGISQALFTTEFGLVIAIPGMVIGRLLDRKEMKMREEIEQIKEYLNKS